MKYTPFTPSVEVQKYVESYWYVESGAQIHILLADGKSDIILNCGGNFIELQSGHVQKQGDSLLCTLFDRFCSLQVTDNSKIFGIRLKNAMMSEFCSMSFSGLVSQGINIEDIFDKDFYTMLHDASFLSNGRFIAHACDEAIKKYLSRLKAKKSRTLDISPALKLIELHNGNIKSQQLSSLLGIHEKTLQRAFSQNLGLGAKTYASIVRFNATIKALKNYNNISCLAQDFGYYDHSHLIHDFKRFGNLAPTDHWELSDFYKTHLS